MPTITGTPANDTLNGTSEPDRLIGLGGNDMINGGPGADQMEGGPDDDIFIVDDAHDVVLEADGEGFDTVYTYVDHWLHSGSSVERLSAADWRLSTPLALFGNELANLIEGNAGNNFIDGGGGADTMVGFGGDDVYIVDDAGDTIAEYGDTNYSFASRSNGFDVAYISVSYRLSAGSYVEVLRAADRHSLAPLQLFGNELASAIEGNAGNNLIASGGGGDSLYGFDGDDTYIVTSASDQVFEEFASGHDVIYATSNVVLRRGCHVERLSAIDWRGTDPISLTGNELANLVEGNAGNNVLDGGGGGDTMVGFEGDDHYVVHDSRDLVIEAAGQGTDSVSTVIDYELPLNVENALAVSGGSIRLIGNGAANTLTGSLFNDFLDGRGGADTLIGRNGNDTYVVDTPADTIIESVASSGGSDTVFSYSDFTLADGLETLSAVDWAAVLDLRLVGNRVANTIHGDAGANFIDGREGNDTLLGHSGADTFAFTTSTSTDTLMDFVPGIDKIALDDAVFAGLSPGALPPQAFVRGSTATRPGATILYDPATGFVLFDQDGSGTSFGGRPFAYVGPGLDIQASDFIVI